MKNKKGFTLVEIIVVLVILAILAAIAVPSVIGYVNEAKESRYIQEAHSIYTVVETEVAKYRATDDPSEDDINDYIKDILSGNTIATADNNQLKGIIAKKTELDDVADTPEMAILIKCIGSVMMLIILKLYSQRIRM